MVKIFQNVLQPFSLSGFDNPFPHFDDPFSPLPKWRYSISQEQISSRTIVIDGRMLHVKRTVPIGAVRLVRLVSKFKQRPNVPYRYHYKKRVSYFLAKIETYRIVLSSLLKRPKQ